MLLLLLLMAMTIMITATILITTTTTSHHHHTRHTPAATEPATASRTCTPAPCFTRNQHQYNTQFNTELWCNSTDSGVSQCTCGMVQTLRAAAQAR